MSTSDTPSTIESSTSYDVTPYPSTTFPQTHPNRLAAMAKLFGMAAPEPRKARVLELGCADGTNLLPMAESLPEAQFLGIDSSKVQITAGQQMLSTAGLANVELRLANILDFGEAEGKFDYIIAHGVYSWVPENVRDKLLAICAAHLTENGVAYVSYNALPGWNMRQSLREMMLFHTRNIADPRVKVQQARALLTFLAESVPAENSAYSQILKGELAQMGRLPDNYLLHDILGELNEPVYFHQFAAHAAKHGLQYLSEPSIFEMLAGNFPEKVHQTLGQLNKQIVAQEQYMDFLRNRSFRQTLLCRSNVSLRRGLSPAGLKEFAFRSSLTKATSAVELVPGVSVGFATASGAQISSTDAFVKAMLLALTETKSVAAVSYTDLLERARTRSRPFLGELASNQDQVEEATLQTNLLNLLAKGLIEIHAEPVMVRTDVPDRPKVGAVARQQALNARLITNRIHQSAPADLVARYIIAACDGTRNREELLSELVARVREGKLQVNEGSVKVTDEAKLRTYLGSSLDQGLKLLANAGFFAP